MSLERRAYPSAPEHRPLLRTLLAQDGSTTRICQALAGRNVEVVMHLQQPTESAPEAVRIQLGGAHWLERVTSLCIDGVVLMDNLSFTRLDAVPEWFLEDLKRGIAPIGHLLDRLFVRRQRIEPDADMAARLWNVVGVPDEVGSRAYRVVTPEGPLMAIFEAYRAGMVSVRPLAEAL